MINIGYDPGFGRSKAAAILDGDLHMAVIPSVVGVGDTETGLLGRMGFRRRRMEKPFTVEIEGLTYVVGPNVGAFSRQSAQRLDFHRLSNGPELRALFYATIYSLLGAGQHTANLMVGLPVEVMADRTVALRTLRELRRWIAAQHTFVVDGDEVTLTIEKVAAAEQPAGAWASWGMDNAGKWARSPSDLTAAVAIADPGFNTLDLWVVQNGQVLKSATGGDTIGMRRAAETMADSIKAAYDVELSLHEADALVTSPRPILSIADGDIPVSSLAGQALDAAAANIVSFVESLWGNARQFRYVIFAGGGMEVAHIREAITRQMPHAIILPRPVMANAIGLARFALRRFRG